MPTVDKVMGKVCSKLIDLPVHHKTEELTTVQMHGNLKVCILQVYGDHPVAPPNGIEDRLVGLHLEASLKNKLIQPRQVFHGPLRPRGLPHNKKTAVESWTGGS